MKSSKSDQQNQAKKIRHTEDKDVDSFIRYMPEYLEELKSKIKVLPKVDEKGQSECSFAEDLYAEKEKAAKSLVEYLEKGPKCLKYVDKELAKFSRNLSRIKSDHGSLHDTHAKEKYRFAERFQRHHIEKNIQRRKKLIDLISKANKLLKKAREKKWPLGKPKKSIRPPSLIAGGKAGGSDINIQGPAPVIPVHQRPALKTEIDSLISLGPLGNKDS